MYCSKDIQFACQCLPQRLKPQTAASVAVFPFRTLSVFPVFLEISKPFPIPFICSVCQSQFCIGPKTEKI